MLGNKRENWRTRTEDALEAVNKIREMARRAREIQRYLDGEEGLDEVIQEITRPSYIVVMKTGRLQVYPEGVKYYMEPGTWMTVLHVDCIDIDLKDMILLKLRKIQGYLLDELTLYAYFDLDMAKTVLEHDMHKMERGHNCEY